MKINFKKLLTVGNVIKAVALGRKLKELKEDPSKTKTEKVTDLAPLVEGELGIEVVGDAEWAAAVERVRSLERELVAARKDLFALVADIRSKVR